jgi:hypothetical protein
VSSIPWSTILAAAERAAAVIPPPLGVVADIALALARWYVEAGCTIDGCPPDVAADVLARARMPIPAADEASARARAEARARVAGLDRASILRVRSDPEARASGLVPRRTLDADEVLGPRPYAAPEHPAAREVYGDDDDGA